MRKTRGERLFNVFNVFILSLLTISFFYPFWHVFCASFSDPTLMRRHTGLLLWPHGFTTMGYQLVMRNPNIYSGYINTLIVVFCGTFLNLAMTTLGAYVLSRRVFVLKGPMMIMVTITMFFGGGLIPFFLVVNRMKMLDTLWSLMIPCLINTYNMIVMRTSFQGLPAELEESGKIDGASDFRILWSIILPVSKAMLAVIGLFYAVSHWNSWFNASIFLRHREKFPLQLVLREILLNSDTTVAGSTLNTDALRSIDQNDFYFKELVQYSTIIVSIVPILCVYPFLQKYFVKGVMIGSLKG